MAGAKGSPRTKGYLQERTITHIVLPPLYKKSPTPIRSGADNIVWKNMDSLAAFGIKEYPALALVLSRR